MATVDASIPLGFKSPTISESMANMSSLLGVQQDYQSLTQSRIKTAHDQAAWNEQQALGRLNPRDYTNPKTGVIDADRYAADAAAATPLTGLGIQRAQQIYQAQGAQIAVKSASQGLSREIRSDVAGRFAALSSDQDAKFTDFVQTAEQIKKDNPGASDFVDSYMSQLSPKDDIGTTHKKATTLNRAVLPPAENVDQPFETNTGAAQVYGTKNQRTGTPTVGSSIANKIPPGFQMIEDAATHNKYLYNAQTGETRPLGQGQPGNPNSKPSAPGNAPPQRQIGEADAQAAQVETNFKNRQATVQAAQGAPQQVDQIKKALALIGPKGIETGTGAHTQANIEKAFANWIPGFDTTNTKAEKLDLLDKFMERISATAAQTSGNPSHTDAAADSIRKQFGSTGYSAAALKDVLEYAGSTTIAAQAKDSAQRKFFAQKGNSVMNQHEFEEKWRDSYNPTVFQEALKPKAQIQKDMAAMSPEDKASFLKSYHELKEMGAKF